MILGSLMKALLFWVVWTHFGAKLKMKVHVVVFATTLVSF
jgi:hypothetical protein